MKKENKHNFTWSRTWILGPTLVLSLLLLLTFVTCRDLSYRSSRRMIDGESKELDTQRTPFQLKQTTSSVSLEADRKLLHEEVGNEAISAARRLWQAGYREDVLEALEYSTLLPSTRLGILIIASAERSDRLRQAANRILQMKGLTAELTVLCKAIIVQDN